MLQNLFSLRQFWLTKWSFFVHSTTRNAPYVHLRLDLILQLCKFFPIASSAALVDNIFDLIGCSVLFTCEMTDK